MATLFPIPGLAFTKRSPALPAKPSQLGVGSVEGYSGMMADPRSFTIDSTLSAMRFMR
jgi:hypothetical protein